MPNGRYRTTDTNNHGVLDTTGVITKSSNVGAAKIAAKWITQTFYSFVRRMGYGESTHSGFPGEASGLFPSPARWSGTSKQTMSYGYGLSVTPLQIARVYAALANGGRLITPSFVKGQPVRATQALGTPLAHEVLKMMQTVTEPGGTAYPQGTILGYHVAGKTGTARKASGGGYSRQYVAFFAGVVPVDDPRFAMVVVISDPDPSRGHGYYGGLISAPVFHNVMEGALRLMDVPPDDIDTWLAAQAADQAKRVGEAPITASATTSAAAEPEVAQ